MSCGGEKLAEANGEFMAKHAPENSKEAEFIIFLQKRLRFCPSTCDSTKGNTQNETLTLQKQIRRVVKLRRGKANYKVDIN